MTRGTPFHCLPSTEAGCKMPTAHGILRADANYKTKLEIANERFLAALDRYFRRGGRG